MAYAVHVSDVTLLICLADWQNNSHANVGEIPTVKLREKQHYGDEKASKFGSLMREHLVIAVQLVKAAKAGNSKLAADLERKWYANADEIAAFLNSINPYWPKDVLMTMLHEHLALTKSEAVARLTKDYATDIAMYEKVEKQALAMADALTEGIVKQFPDKFKK